MPFGLHASLSAGSEHCFLWSPSFANVTVQLSKHIIPIRVQVGTTRLIDCPCGKAESVDCDAKLCQINTLHYVLFCQESSYPMPCAADSLSYLSYWVLASNRTSDTSGHLIWRRCPAIFCCRQCCCRRCLRYTGGIEMLQGAAVRANLDRLLLHAVACWCMLVHAGTSGCVPCVLFGTCVLGAAVLPHLLQASAAPILTHKFETQIDTRNFAPFKSFWILLNCSLQIVCRVCMRQRAQFAVEAYYLQLRWHRALAARLVTRSNCW